MDRRGQPGTRRRCPTQRSAGSSARFCLRWVLICNIVAAHVMASAGDRDATFQKCVER